MRHPSTYVLLGMLVWMGAVLSAMRQGEADSTTHHPDPHWRAVTVTRAIDGDTLELDVEHSWGGVTYTQKRVAVRVLGIDTPEIRGAERSQGLAARAEAEAWLAECDGELLAWSRERDSFGRPLAEVVCATTGESLGAYLLASGHAEEYRE